MVSSTSKHCTKQLLAAYLYIYNSMYALTFQTVSYCFCVTWSIRNYQGNYLIVAIYFFTSPLTHSPCCVISSDSISSTLRKLSTIWIAILHAFIWSQYGHSYKLYNYNGSSLDGKSCKTFIVTITPNSTVCIVLLHTMSLLVISLCYILTSMSS